MADFPLNKLRNFAAGTTTGDSSGAVKGSWAVTEDGTKVFRAIAAAVLDAWDSAIVNLFTGAKTVRAVTASSTPNADGSGTADGQVAGETVASTTGDVTSAQDVSATRDVLATRNAQAAKVVATTAIAQSPSPDTNPGTNGVAVGELYAGGAALAWGYFHTTGTPVDTVHNDRVFNINHVSRLAQGQYKVQLVTPVSTGQILIPNVTPYDGPATFWSIDTGTGAGSAPDLQTFTINFRTYDNSGGGTGDYFPLSDPSGFFVTVFGA